MSDAPASAPTPVTSMLLSSMDLRKGIAYLRLLGAPDPYQFIPVDSAPIGAVGELVTAVGPGAWHNGPLVVVCMDANEFQQHHTSLLGKSK